MKRFLIMTMIIPILLAIGCSRGAIGGAAVGAGAAGAAYEYQNKMALEDLEDDWKAGQISKDEYLRRKKEIEKRSLVY
ncbi:MAG: hypothetical protein KJO32_08550 [Deltaproteobacteria bacterium]|nr:hypothetical protein [Deltaproteobacteria bacterium]